MGMAGSKAIGIKIRSFSDKAGLKIHGRHRQVASGGGALRYVIVL